MKKSLGFRELIQPLLISPAVWDNLLLVCPPSVSLNCTNPTESKMVFEHQAQSFLRQDPWFTFLVLAWTVSVQHVTQLGHSLQRCGGMAPKMSENFNLVSYSALFYS